MFPILGRDHHLPLGPYWISEKTDSYWGTCCPSGRLAPACLRVELICLPAATRWGCEPNLEALRLRPEASPSPPLYRYGLLHNGLVTLPPPHRYDCKRNQEKDGHLLTGEPLARNWAPNFTKNRLCCPWRTKATTMAAQGAPKWSKGCPRAPKGCPKSSQ